MVSEAKPSPQSKRFIGPLNDSAVQVLDADGEEDTAVNLAF